MQFVARGTAAQADRDFNSLAVKLKIWDQGFKTLKHAITYGFYGLLVYKGAEIITAIVQPLAGKKTDVNVAVNFFTESGVNAALGLSLILNVGLIFVLRMRHKLCQDERERFGRQIAALERGIDPERTSSGLTERGKTPPEDL
jgi:hypothetical protein